MCAVVALYLICAIPVVSKLPEGTSTVAEYVVNTTVARFGIPVVTFLFVASACAVVGHNKGDVRPGYDFAAKLCSFAAATFAFFAGLGGVWLSWMLPNPILGT